MATVKLKRVGKNGYIDSVFGRGASGHAPRNAGAPHLSESPNQINWTQLRARGARRGGGEVPREKRTGMLTNENPQSTSPYCAGRALSSDCDDTETGGSESLGAFSFCERQHAMPEQQPDGCALLTCPAWLQQEATGAVEKPQSGKKRKTARRKEMILAARSRESRFGRIIEFPIGFCNRHCAGRDFKSVFEGASRPALVRLKRRSWGRRRRGRGGGVAGEFCELDGEVDGDTREDIHEQPGMAPRRGYGAA
jgi:hypothetical protein